MNAGRSNIANRNDVDIVSVQRADQNVAFVTGTDHAYSHRIIRLLIAIVHRAHSGGRHTASRNRLNQELSPIMLSVIGGDRAMIVVETVFSLFRCQVNHGYATSDSGSGVEGCEKKKSNPPYRPAQVAKMTNMANISIA